MSEVFIDTSVLVAAMTGSEAFHAECRQIVRSGAIGIYAHGIVETFSTLTGGGRGFRLDAESVRAALEMGFVPLLKAVGLSPGETLSVMGECKSRGVRGGAIYDFLHLAAAKKAGAKRFYTLNTADFTAFHRAGDPEIVHPRDHGT